MTCLHGELQRLGECTVMSNVGQLPGVTNTEDAGASKERSSRFNKVEN